MNRKENEDIYIPNEEMDQVLGQIPRWLIRWGMAIILLVFAIFFVGASLFKFPDKLTAFVKISAVYEIADNKGKMDSELIGTIYLPCSDMRRVESGMQVNIKLINYPYMEYGILKGQVNSMEPITSGDSCMVKVGFPNGIVSTYNKELKLLLNMNGTAEIIINNESLLQKILTPLKSSWKNSLIPRN